jgi:hypothetical protein
MSALPPKADIAGRQLNVRFVTEADILRRSKQCRYSSASSVEGKINVGDTSMWSLADMETLSPGCPVTFRPPRKCHGWCSPVAEQSR